MLARPSFGDLWAIPNLSHWVTRAESKAASVVRDLGLPVAWMVGTACGWKYMEHGDLLTAVARGAAAWLGTLLVWTAGARLLEGALRNADAQDERADAAKGAAPTPGRSDRAAQS